MGCFKYPLLQEDAGFDRYNSCAVQNEKIEMCLAENTGCVLVSRTPEEVGLVRALEVKREKKARLLLASTVRSDQSTLTATPK